MTAGTLMVIISAVLAVVISILSGFGYYAACTLLTFVCVPSGVLGLILTSEGE